MPRDCRDCRLLPRASFCGSEARARASFSFRVQPLVSEAVSVCGNLVPKLVLRSVLNNAVRPLSPGPDTGRRGHRPATWQQKQAWKWGA